MVHRTTLKRFAEPEQIQFLRGHVSAGQPSGIAAASRDSAMR